MLKAKDALKHYDSLKLEAEVFIKEEIEPKIREVMETSRSVTIMGKDGYYVGYSFYFPAGYTSTHGHNQKLTAAVFQLLGEAGYRVGSKLITSGDEVSSGKVEFIIDWSEAE